MEYKRELVTAKEALELSNLSSRAIDKLVSEINSQIISAGEKGEFSVVIDDGNWFGAFQPKEYSEVKRLLIKSGYTLYKVSGDKKENLDSLEIKWG